MNTRTRRILSIASVAVIVGVAMAQTTRPITNAPKFRPVAPHSLSAKQAKDSTSVNLQWTYDGSVATGFEVERRKKNPDGTFTTTVLTVPRKKP